jgi:hypothetical protein
MQQYANNIEDNAHNAVIGASIQIYLGGTTTAASLFSDSGGVTPKTNPLTSDSGGNFSLYAADGTYDGVITKIGITTKTFTFTLDSTTQFVTTTALAASSGASLAGFIQSGAGAVARTVQSKSRDIFNAFDYIPVADNAAITAGTSTVDEASHIMAALAALPASGGMVELPAGQIQINSSITLSRGQHLVGRGFSAASGVNRGTTFLKHGNFDGLIISAPECGLHNLGIRGDAGNGGDGIYIKGPDFVLEGVSSTDHGGVGLRVGDKTAASNSSNSGIAKSVHLIGNTSHGLLILDANAGPNANVGIYEGVDSRSNGGDGIQVGNALDNVFILPVCETNTGYGIHLATGANGQEILFPYTEANVTSDIIFDAGTNRNTLFGVRYGFATVTDNGTDNTLITRVSNITGCLQFINLWLQNMNVNNGSAAGKLVLSQTGVGAYLFRHSGASQIATTTFDNPGFTHQVKVDGVILTAAANSGQVAAGQVMFGSTHQTTIGANGAASALTANPVGYLKISVDGADKIIPYYNA